MDKQTQAIFDVIWRATQVINDKFPKPSKDQFSQKAKDLACICSKFDSNYSGHVAAGFELLLGEPIRPLMKSIQEETIYVPRKQPCGTCISDQDGTSGGAILGGR